MIEVEEMHCMFQCVSCFSWGYFLYFDYFSMIFALVTFYSIDIGVCLNFIIIIPFPHLIYIIHLRINYHISAQFHFEIVTFVIYIYFLKSKMNREGILNSF